MIGRCLLSIHCQGGITALATSLLEKKILTYDAQKIFQYKEF